MANLTTLLFYSMANQKKITPFSIHTKDVVLVKPSKPTPSTVLSLSTIDNNLDLNILCQTIYAYKANPINGGQKDPSSVIKEGLSKALFFYYPLAGKIKSDHTDGKLRIICDNASSGVPFLEATANCELSSLNYLDGIDVETANQLLFDYHYDSEEDETSGHHVLVFQVTKFLCGGFTIGMGISHHVCDGFGASQFFRAMAELASGKDEPSVKPIWEREKLVGTILKEPIKFPIDKTSVAISPFWPTSSHLSHQCFNVKPESIRKLKTSLTREDNNQNITTLESLGAYVWRSRNRAMKLSSEGKTMFCLAVEIRQHVDPPLPDGYYGNAFVTASVVLKVKELEEKPLHEIVKLIKQSKQGACRNDYVRNCINVTETMIEGNVRTVGTGASTVITDWRQLGLLEDVDFGWKGSVNLVPVTWKMLGYVVDLCLFLPPSHLDPAMKGGVRVFVSLPEAAMPKFREEMEKLDSIR